MSIEVFTYPRFKITLDLDECQFGDLASAIYEAMEHVDNWRSDPSLLAELREKIEAAMKPQPQKYDGPPRAAPFLWDGTGPPPPWYPPQPVPPSAMEGGT